MPVLRTLAIACSILAALPLGAQEPAAGFVRGRLLSAFGMGPVVAADLELRTENAAGFRIRSRAKSDGEGRFQIKSGVLIDGAWLIVRARGLSPRVVPLRPTPGGEGLLLDDLILDRGAALTLRLAEEGQPQDLDPARVRASFHPILGERDLIPLGLPPLIETAFDKSGLAKLEPLPSRPGLIVISDGRRHAAPRSIFWRPGREDAELKELRLRAGRELEVSARAAGSKRVSAYFRVSSGAWRPEGGKEFQLSFSSGMSSNRAGGFFLVAAHLPEGRIEGELRGENESAFYRAVSGGTLAPIDLVPHVASRIRVRAANGGASVDRIQARVGNRSFTSVERGEVAVMRHPDTVDLRLEAPGYLARRLRLDATNPDQRAPVLEIRLQPLSREEGRVTDLDDEPLAGAWVVAAPRSAVASNLEGGAEDRDSRFGPARGIGLPVVARSDAKGKFRSAPVLGAGLTRLRGYLAGRKELAAEKTSSGARVSIRTRGLRDCARVQGKIEVRRGIPARGVDVFLVDAMLDRAAFSDPAAIPHLEAPQLRHTLTNDKGEFRFVAVLPSSYRVFVRAPGHAPFLSPPTRLVSGANRVRLEYRLPPRRASQLLLTVPGPFLVRPRDPQSAEFFVAPPWPEDRTEPLKLDLSGLGGSEVLVAPLHRDHRLHERGPADLAAWPGLGREGQRRLPLPVDELAVGFSEYAPHRLQGRITLGGELPDGHALTATLYPVAAPAGFSPLRLSPHPTTGRFDVFLPRGLWVLEAEAIGFGSVVTAPIRVGIDGASRRELDIAVAIPAFHSAVGFLSGDAPGSQVSDSDWSASALVLRTGGDRFLEPFLRRRAYRSPRRDGSFDLLEIPSGVVELSLRRGDRGFCRTWEARAFDFVELGDLPLQLLHAPLPSGEEIRRTWSRGRGPGATPRRGPEAAFAFEAEQAESLSEDQAFAPRRMSMLWPAAESGGFDPVPDPISRRRRGIGLRLSVGGEVLTQWPLEIIPANEETFAFGRPLWQLSTDDRGRVTLPPDLAEDAHFSLQWADRQGVTYRGLRRMVDLDLRRGLAIGTGRLVVDVGQVAGDGKVEGARVRLVSSSWRGLLTGSAFRRQFATVATKLTDRSGRAVFDQVPFGIYDLKVHAPDLGYTIAHDVEVKTASRDARSEILLSAPSSIGVRVRNREGDLIAGGQVFLFDEKNTEIRDEVEFWCNPEGFVEVSDLRPGTYAVLAQGLGHPPQFVDEVTVGPGGRVILDAFLEAPGVLEVLVRGSGGRPTPGARVVARGPNPAIRLFGASARRAEETPVRTDVRGRIRWASFPAGAFQVDVEVPGFAPAQVKGELPAGGERKIEVRLEKLSGNLRTPAGGGR
jgi:hypothetical protein